VAITTTLSSASKTLALGPHLPVAIIGERINPSGKKKLTEAVEAGDVELIKQEALLQVESGADLLDVNVGVPGVDEVEMMVKAVKAIQGVTDVPLVLDSSRPEVLQAGLEVYQGKTLVNSVDGEKEKNRELWPIIKKFGAAVIGLTMDETGIPATAEQRLELAQIIVTRAEGYGIPKQDVFIDCLALSVSADHNSAALTLESIRLVNQKLGVNQVLGVSNVSFGLPERDFVNHVFLGMCVQNGLNCPIMDPVVMDMKMAIRVADMLLGRDEWCGRYLNAYREKMASKP